TSPEPHRGQCSWRLEEHIAHLIDPCSELARAVARHDPEQDIRLLEHLSSDLASSHWLGATVVRIALHPPGLHPEHSQIGPPNTELRCGGDRRHPRPLRTEACGCRRAVLQVIRS